MAKRRTALLGSLLILGTSALVAPPAGAHTETDLVAVPAGGEATVSLQPTHGCEGSPTVEVAIQAPVAGATAGEVEGWTSSATEEGGRTVLEWTGGSLPADAEGSFPVTFTAPDTPGELLVFPAVQYCEDGGELAWIDGDPEGEYPAPRVLVLPAGSEPAGSIDDVPADAPGRDQLTTIIDVDRPGAEGSSGEEAGTTSSTVEVGDGGADGTSTTLEETDTPPVGDTETEAEPAEDDEESRGLAVVIAVAVVALVGAVAGFMLSKRRGAGS